MPSATAYHDVSPDALVPMDYLDFLCDFFVHFFDFFWGELDSAMHLL